MSKPREPIDYEGLNPGIRETVRMLREMGFETVDSGDGQTHECECDPEFPYVSIRVKPKRLVKEARRLVALLSAFGIDLGEWNADGQPEGVVVDASYFPVLDEAFVQVVGLDDRQLSEERETPAAMAGDGVGASPLT